MADYVTSGFDNFLLRPLEVTYVQQKGIDTNVSFEQINASQVSDGIITSRNGILEFNLEEDYFRVKDRELERFRIGKLSDGTIGVKIVNDNNETILQSIDKKNLINLQDSPVSVVSNFSKLPRVLASTSNTFIPIDYTSFNFSTSRDSIILCLISFLILRDDFGSGGNFLTELDIALNVDGNLSLFDYTNSAESFGTDWYMQSITGAGEIANVGIKQTLYDTFTLSKGSHTARLMWKTKGNTNTSQTLLEHSISCFIF